MYGEFLLPMRLPLASIRSIRSQGKRHLKTFQSVVGETQAPDPTYRGRSVSRVRSYHSITWIACSVYTRNISCNFAGISNVADLAYMGTASCSAHITPVTDRVKRGRQQWSRPCELRIVQRLMAEAQKPSSLTAKIFQCFGYEAQPPVAA